MVLACSPTCHSLATAYLRTGAVRTAEENGALRACWLFNLHGATGNTASLFPHPNFSLTSQLIPLLLVQIFCPMPLVVFSSFCLNSPMVSAHTK
eukprot:328321-Pleurochrysis_carterae.AAC.2